MKVTEGWRRLQSIRHSASHFILNRVACDCGVHWVKLLMSQQKAAVLLDRGAALTVLSEWLLSNDKNCGCSLGGLCDVAYPECESRTVE
jgi:hypothetical protein